MSEHVKLILIDALNVRRNAIKRAEEQLAEAKTDVTNLEASLLQMRQMCTEIEDVIAEVSGAPRYDTL